MLQTSRHGQFALTNPVSGRRTVKRDVTHFGIKVTYYKQPSHWARTNNRQLNSVFVCCKVHKRVFSRESQSFCLLNLKPKSNYMLYRPLQQVVTLPFAHRLFYTFLFILRINSDYVLKTALTS
jgi:hypothetical protein